MDISTGNTERQTFLQELARRAGAGDAEAAFQIGAHNVHGGTEAHYDAADRAFLKAVQFGGSSWAWLAVDEYLYQDVCDRFAQWMTRAITLDFPLPTALGITVDEDTFAPKGDRDGITWAGARFQIHSDNAPAVVAALTAARERLVRVDQNGHEWPTDEAVGEAVSTTPHDRFENPLWTSAYVSPPCPDDAGPCISADTDGSMWGPMARTMLLVVIEELTAAGVNQARITSAPVKSGPT